MHPLAIGPIRLPDPVLLVPMSGVTDAPFRRLVASLGAGLLVSEMTACAALARRCAWAALALPRLGARRRHHVRFRCASAAIRRSSSAISDLPPDGAP
jgi:tRNA-dihydrouridine synthase